MHFSNLYCMPQCAISRHSIRSVSPCSQGAYILTIQIQINTHEMQHWKHSCSSTQHRLSALRAPKEGDQGATYLFTKLKW